MNHRQLADTLLKLRLGISASDLHGSLTGFLCAGGKAAADDWLDALALDPGDVGEGSRGDLAELYRHCRTQLDDTEFGFEPLLPDDEASLAARAEALVEWCRGFIGGAGLAGAGARRAPLSADAEEIMRDFGAIASSQFDYDADEEKDEMALTEVVEFVRVGVLLLHRELEGGQRTTPAPPSPRLH